MPNYRQIVELAEHFGRLISFIARRRIENNDWDFDYNRQHPTEKPRQKDPDISDEEYAEKARRINSLYRKTKQYLQQKEYFR